MIQKNLRSILTDLGLQSLLCACPLQSQVPAPSSYVVSYSWTGQYKTWLGFSWIIQFRSSAATSTSESAAQSAVIADKTAADD